MHRDCLKGRLSDAEVAKLLEMRASLHVGEGVNFDDHRVREYFGFLMQIRPGDELWNFMGPEKELIPLVSFGGIAIVRDGAIVDTHMTWCS